MLADNKLEVLKELIRQSSREEIIWTNGYLAGLLAQKEVQQPVEITTNNVTVKPTIIYGTETGNSKKLASQLQALLKKNKIQSKVIDAFQYPVEKLDKEEFLIVIMSTQGEGDPPQNAIKFFDNISNSSANLAKTRFAVLGLGDSSYPLFCKAGEDIDQQLKRLGAQQAVPFQKADVDFTPVAESWFAAILNSLQTINTGNATSVAVTSAAVVEKKNYTGIVRHKVILNDRDSKKETHHIEIETDEPVVYEPGDAIGFYPENRREELLEIAVLLKAEARSNELLTKNSRGLSKKSLDALSKVFEITITEDKADLLDILKKYPIKEGVSFDSVLELLHPIAPRLYSIASAAEAHEGEIHITVSKNTFTVDNTIKTGLCSQFLADFTKDQEIAFYIHKNRNFKLPEPDKDVIMIGPGTGIAPFRSFLAHRDATGAEGKNWLFFGEQHFVSDFYYQTEIQEWLATGVLTHLDTAFSRDQKHKIYVQDRLKQKAKEVCKWLENGAYLYICGQKDPMSTDVEMVLRDIIATEKNVSTEEAKTILESWETEGRYQKDVY
ncbi:diflavin oxidoreductase [Flavobacterium cerinum]|uniref:Flavodoxin domain-containing protein n=1 Tax=Flavobacterium cerinum TaxID=2502784 RepID=A0ABY5IN77_9FLAO|nr:flavodoxin domain-containing protein [Flavobacterium cerinum]UUC44245.1 flavodoxin domain-containing protein [Flavobacterium cerinum]